MLDRVAPTRRPNRRNDGTQRWESLLFCHWQVPVEVLRPIVPAQLQIDTFDGHAYVGVVPFKMRQIRPRWLPHRFALNFLETNVRTYVVYKDQPGVFFFSLDANSALAVMAARAGWSLPYHYAKMTCDRQGDLFQYRSHRTRGSGHHEVSFRVTDELGPAVLESREHFLLERYLLFTNRGETIQVGQVHHQPYHAALAVVDTFSDSLVSAARLPAIKTYPEFAHYCTGVDVEVFGIHPA